MEKKIKIIFVFIVFIVMYLSTNSAHAAPAAWGIAFNHDTKECARYWEGDEFVNYDLPQGWKQYYPCDYGIDDGYYGYRALRADIEAIIGTFNFTEEEFCSMWPVEFCNITGYTYVSDNIGYQAKIDLEQTISTIIVIMLIIFFIVAISLKIKTKEFLPFLHKYVYKGIFIGILIGIIFALLLFVFSTNGWIWEYPIIFGIIVIIFNFPYLLLYFFSDTYFYMDLLILIIYNSIVWGFLGLTIALIIQKIRSKKEKLKD